MSAIIQATFEGAAITTLVFRDRPAIIATEVGRALGYASNGKKLITRMGEWGDELVKGTDYDVLEGADLADFKALLGDDPKNGSSFSSRLTILYESGLHLVCLKTEKPLGKRLRRWLADEVLPQLVRAGRVESITPTPSVTEERIARIETALTSLPQTLATSMATAMAVVMRETMAAVLEASSAQRLAPVGEAGSREIRRSLRTYGELMATPDDVVSAAKWRQSGDVELRAHVGFTGAGRRWADLAFDDYAKVRSKLAEMLQRARRNAEERGQMAQMPLKEATG